MSRTAEIARRTAETDVRLRLALDGAGEGTRRTGVGFFDHMLDLLARHGRLELDVEAAGDLETGPHHTVEDVGIVLGQAFKEALGDKAGVRRFASGLYPLDEALIEVALDLSGRAHAAIDLPYGEVLPLGDPPFNPEMGVHFLESFAQQALITLHVTKRAGVNTHHVLEAAFKGLARTLRDAVRVEGGDVPSTKGAL